jgi:hypothetical protein
MFIVEFIMSIFSSFRSCRALRELTLMMVLLTVYVIPFRSLLAEPVPGFCDEDRQRLNQLLAQANALQGAINDLENNGPIAECNSLSAQYAAQMAVCNAYGAGTPEQSTCSDALDGLYNQMNTACGQAYVVYITQQMPLLEALAALQPQIDAARQKLQLCEIAKKGTKIGVSSIPVAGPILGGLIQ